MKTITLGSTGIQVPQNGFGALPIQRVSFEEAGDLIVRAFEGGMRFFDTARAYSDSEEKMGRVIAPFRDQIFLATKTMAKTPEAFWQDLETSLSLLGVDSIDIYQFHCVDQCWRPGDGTGMYECMLEAKERGLIKHIGVTAHKLEVAFELVESGLYETLQYPLSYLSGPRELGLVQLCQDRNMGFIAMKGLAGGLLTNSAACMAFMTQFDNVVPIWGVQRQAELDEWLSYFSHTPVLDDDIQAAIAADKAELGGDFCRGCGYCLPCPEGIVINQCARMSLMVRRAPSAAWTNDFWQEQMAKIDNCRECGLCMTRCPYGLQIPNLLRKNLADYEQILADLTM